MIAHDRIADPGSRQIPTSPSFAPPLSSDAFHYETNAKERNGRRSGSCCVIRARSNLSKVLVSFNQSSAIHPNTPPALHHSFPSKGVQKAFSSIQFAVVAGSRVHTLIAMPKVVVCPYDARFLDESDDEIDGKCKIHKTQTQI